MTKNWIRRKNFFEFVKLNGNKVCSHTRTSNSIAASFAILGVQKEHGDNCVHPNDKLSISTQINDVCSLMAEHGHRTDIVCCYLLQCDGPNSIIIYIIWYMAVYKYDTD